MSSSFEQIFPYSWRNLNLSSGRKARGKLIAKFGDIPPGGILTHNFLLMRLTPASKQSHIARSKLSVFKMSFCFLSCEKTNERLPSHRPMISCFFLFPRRSRLRWPALGTCTVFVLRKSSNSCSTSSSTTTTPRIPSPTSTIDRPW